MFKEFIIPILAIVFLIIFAIIGIGLIRRLGQLANVIWWQQIAHLIPLNQKGAVTDEDFREFLRHTRSILPRPARVWIDEMLRRGDEVNKTHDNGTVQFPPSS